MKRIFFDFDGTLADTSRGIIEGYNYAFKKKGLTIVAEKKIRENIGPPLKDVLANLAPGENEDGISELATLYREYFSSVGLYELQFFDGTREMLEDLFKKNVKLCILSSKPTVFIEKILEKYEYDSYFSEIDGVSLELINKTKKERLRDRILSDNLTPSECIVVGDRAEDMIAAHYCSTDFIGVLFGYGTEDELKDALHAKCVEDLKKLLMGWVEGES